MADKFSKVKHTSVIIWGEFSGILDGGADGAGCRHPNRLQNLRRPVYPGVGASGVGPGHSAVAVVGRNRHPGVGASGWAPGRICGASGMPGV